MKNIGPIATIVLVGAVLALAVWNAATCTRWEETGAQVCERVGTSSMRCAPEKVCVERAR